MPSLSYFTSFDFYILLFTVAVGACFVLWGAIWLWQAGQPSDRLSLKVALKWLGKYGVPIPINRNEEGERVDLTEQSKEEALRLYRYTRRFTGVMFIGMGVGVIVGALISEAAGWLLYQRMPELVSALPTELLELWFMPVFIGMMLGMFGSALVSIAYMQKQSTPQGTNGVHAPEQHEQFPWYRRYWLALASGLVITLSLAFSLALATGKVPGRTLYNFTTSTPLPTPYWLLFGSPITITLLVLLAEITSRILASRVWPLPGGVAMTLAEKARQRTVQKICGLIWATAALATGLLWLGETSLSSNFLTLPFLFPLLMFLYLSPIIFHAFPPPVSVSKK